ncbi:MAG: hypothetical protein IMW89_21605 [Ktedonobacteraceae bacterium]|nr:hypothetical protein [Ktedonobacteraceae bacterium]
MSKITLFTGIIFASIFLISFIAALLDLWLHRKNLGGYPRLGQLWRREL